MYDSKYKNGNESTVNEFLFYFFRDLPNINNKDVDLTFEDYLGYFTLCYNLVFLNHYRQSFKYTNRRITFSKAPQSDMDNLKTKTGQEKG